MAATDEKPKRGRPGKVGAEPKPKSLYHIFTEVEEGGLDPLGQFEGRNGTEAVQAYIDAGNESNGSTFVVIPDRNYARVTVAVETKTRVKLTTV